MEIIVREEEDGKHRLYTQSPAETNAAGERLRKGGEYPVESYVYDTHEAATEALIYRRWISISCILK